MPPKPEVSFAEQSYSLRLGRFDHPTPRTWIGRPSVGNGCALLALRGDGAVSVVELTIDGRTPREPPLLRANNPGTVAFVGHADRAWAVVDDVLHTLNLVTMEWDGQLTVPKGVSKARLVAAGVDSVLLGPATNQLRHVWRATRNASGAIELSEPIEASLPTAIVPGPPERWCHGETGRVGDRDVPRFLYPLVAGTALYAHAVDAKHQPTSEILRLDGEPVSAARKVCIICGIDGEGRVVVMTEGGTSKQMPPGSNPSRIELLDANTLRSLARQSIGTSWGARQFALCGAGTLAIIEDKKLRLVTWDGIAATPQMTRAVIAVP